MRALCKLKVPKPVAALLLIVALCAGLGGLGYVLAGPAADAIGATEVLLGGAVIACGSLALGLVPRETRMLERLAAPR
jgi:hypothetical protein